MLWRRIKERQLRMIWTVRKASRGSFLIGTAHFSPYSFKGSLTNLLQEAEYALFEGPLDAASMEKVVAAGSQDDTSNSILDELDAHALDVIARMLGLNPSRQGLLFHGQRPVPTTKALLTRALGPMKPWMTFFSIYATYLQENGWKHSVDMEAYAIANRLGKTVVFMETIEEQIEVLESMSREQIIDFLQRIDSWSTYTRNFIRWYLKGDLTKIASNPYLFPTRNPHIIGSRDAIFYERMQPYLERGRAAIFVGSPHVSGITRILVREGYWVERHG